MRRQAIEGIGKVLKDPEVSLQGRSTLQDLEYLNAKMQPLLVCIVVGVVVGLVSEIWEVVSLVIETLRGFDCLRRLFLLSPFLPTSTKSTNSLEIK